MSEYQFTSDWFSKNLIVWEEIFKRFRPSRILEIGAYEGRATCWLVEQCSRYNPVEIFCVDTWEGGVEHKGTDFKEVENRFNHNIQLAVNSQNVHKATVIQVKGTSLAGLSKIAAHGIRNFDMVYVDGSHMASDVFFDAAMAFQLCKVGGLIIFDDWNAPHEEKDKFDFPRLAITAFIKVHENKVEDLPMKVTDEDGNEVSNYTTYQRYLIKRAD